MNTRQSQWGLSRSIFRDINESFFGRELVWQQDMNKRLNKRVMGKIWVAGRRTTLRVGGQGKEVSWGRQDRVVPGVATLDRGPDQSSVG